VASCHLDQLLDQGVGDPVSRLPGESFKIRFKLMKYILYILLYSYEFRGNPRGVNAMLEGTSRIQVRLCAYSEDPDFGSFPEIHAYEFL
jgi:hypothetical protein